MKVAAAWIVLALPCLSGVALARQNAEFTIVPAGGPLLAWAMSGDGNVLVGSGNLGPNAEPWRWTRGLSAQGFGLGDGSARAVSRDGTVIVGTAHVQPFVWRSGTFETLPLGPGLTYLGGGTGISAHGDVIVGSGTGLDQHSHAYRWSSATGTQDLGLLPGYRSSAAIAVSADGAAVAGTAATYEIWPTLRRAFRWTHDQGMIDLGVVPGFASSEARAISGDGRVIVGRAYNSNSQGVAFVWRMETGMLPLGVPSAYCWADSVSYDGTVIAGRSGPLCVWTEALGMTDFKQLLLNNGANVQDITFAQLLLVSHDGRHFGGQCTNNTAYYRSWVATLPVGFGCYANCDGSHGLHIADFQCFINKWMEGRPYANCDGSTDIPAINANDFQCFLNRFAAGCS